MICQTTAIALTSAGILALVGLAIGLPRAVRAILAHIRTSRDAELAAARAEAAEEHRLRAISSDAYTRHMLVCPMIEPLAKEHR